MFYTLDQVKQIKAYLKNKRRLSVTAVDGKITIYLDKISFVTIEQKQFYTDSYKLVDKIVLDVALLIGASGFRYYTLEGSNNRKHLKEVLGILGLKYPLKLDYDLCGDFTTSYYDIDPKNTKQQLPIDNYYSF